jgi:hypothetical protein
MNNNVVQGFILEFKSMAKDWRFWKKGLKVDIYKIYDNNTVSDIPIESGLMSTGDTLSITGDGFKGEIRRDLMGRYKILTK